MAKRRTTRRRTTRRRRSSARGVLLKDAMFAGVGVAGGFAAVGVLGPRLPLPANMPSRSLVGKALVGVLGTMALAKFGNRKIAVAFGSGATAAVLMEAASGTKALSGYSGGYSPAAFGEGDPMLLDADIVTDDDLEMVSGYSDVAVV